MPDQWMTETCPACQTLNWLNDGDPTDTTVDDIGSFGCRKCGVEVRLFDGEHGDQYFPHVSGASPWDEFQCGRHAAGLEKPG